MTTAPPPGTATEQLGPVEGEGVGLDHPHAQRLDLGPEHGQHVAVDLHRGDRGAGFDQGQGQRAQPGPDLDHPLPGADAGQPDDPPDGVAVGHEVLAQGPAGPEVVGQEQLVDLRSAMGHPVSVSPRRPERPVTDCAVTS